MDHSDSEGDDDNRPSPQLEFSTESPSDASTSDNEQPRQRPRRQSLDDPLMDDLSSDAERMEFTPDPDPNQGQNPTNYNTDQEGRRRSARDKKQVNYKGLLAQASALMAKEDHNNRLINDESAFASEIRKIAHHEAFLTNMEDDPENFSFDDAWKHPNDSKKWKDAIFDELESMKKNDVWEVVELPKGKKAIGSRWIFRHKLNSIGAVVRYKARLVARGFSQQKGIDYNDTFAPVAHLSTIRALLTLAADNGWDVHQMDAKTAFLCSPIDTEVYVAIPKGLNIGNKHNSPALRLKKGLYGLKQSPLLWYRRLSDYLLTKNFKMSPYDSTLFVNEDTGATVLIYVDDMLITGPNREVIDNVKKQMKEEFEMTDAGPVEFFLGIQVKRKPGCFILSQEHYVKKVLENFDMTDCAPAPTPLVKHLHKRKDGDNSEPCDKLKYQRAVGCILYLTCCTRPELAFAISHLAQFCADPSVTHWNALKRVFRYLKGHPDAGLQLGGKSQKWEATQTIRLKGKSKEEQSHIVPMSRIFGFTDADHAGDTDDRKSTGGYIFYVNGSCVSWTAKKMNFIATSTMEAEYMAASSAAKEAIWLRALVIDIISKNGMNKDGFYQENYPDKPKPVMMFGDNQASIKVAYNSELHKKSKHIDVAFHFLRQRINMEYICFEYCPTNLMDADFLTKPHTDVRFSAAKKVIGLTA